jgi:PAS domain S-box-containing protein
MNNSLQPQEPDRPTSSFDYARLRSWYLARLRQRIIKHIESGFLTPSSLIAADRKAVQNLILSGLRSEAKPEFQRRLGLLSQFPFEWFLIALPIVGQVVLALTVAFGHLGISSATIAWVSLAIAAFSALLLVVIYEGAIRRRLQSFGLELARLAGIKPQQNRGIDEIAFLERACCALAESLSEAIEREYAIADYALEFINALDDSGSFLAFSPSFAEFTGYGAHELIGKPFTNFVAPEDIDRTSLFLKAVRASQTTVPFENQLVRKDGSVADILWLTEWSDTEAVLFCVGRDISDQKRLERVKSEFVSMVQHDLKTPLLSLSCTLELLSDDNVGGLSEKGKSLLAGALASNARLLRLINQLLDLATIEAGRLPVCKESTSLSAAFKSACATVAAYAQQHGVEVTTQETELAALIDPDRLAQVVVNLLSNAIKFSPQASKVSITAAKEKKNIVVRISDQGPGIPAKFHDVIFQRFKQVHADEKKEGSGLGLSICKAIIEGYNGSIGVESNPGGGSTFWFTIPVANE